MHLSQRYLISLLTPVRCVQNSCKQNGGKSPFGFAASSIAAIAAGGLLYAYATNNQELSQASTGLREVEIHFAYTLGEGEMQTLQVGEEKDQKVLVARY